MACGLAGGATGLYYGHQFDEGTRGGFIAPPGKFLGAVFGFAMGYSLGHGFLNARNRIHTYRLNKNNKNGHQKQ